MRPLSILAALALTATPAAADWWTKNDCIRAIPVPALKAGVDAHSFKLDPDEGTATETAAIAGRPVTIIHSGCETLTWDIRAPLAGNTRPDMEAALAEAKTLIEAVKAHEEFLHGLDDALAFIAARKITPAFGDFVRLDDMEIGASLAIDIVDPRHTLSVVLTRGPL